MSEKRQDLLILIVCVLFFFAGVAVEGNSSDEPEAPPEVQHALALASLREANVAPSTVIIKWEYKNGIMLERYAFDRIEWQDLADMLNDANKRILMLERSIKEEAFCKPLMVR